MDKNRNGSISSKRTWNSQNNEDENDKQSSMKRTNDISNNSDISDAIIPISYLRPGLADWTIRGRCYAKTDLHPYKSRKTDGTVFSFEMRDYSGNIRISAFTNQCLRFFYFN